MSLPADPTQYPYPADKGVSLPYDAEFERMAHEMLLGGSAGRRVSGIAQLADLAFTPTSGLAISVAAGRAFVAGTARVTQGSYMVYRPTATTVTATTANATNPRIDRLVLQVLDADSGDASTTTQIVLVSGTPTAGATLANLSGAATVPNNSLLLGNVLVPAGFTGPFVAGTHFQDTRWGVQIRGAELLNGVATLANTAPFSVAAGTRTGTFGSITVNLDGISPILIEVEMPNVSSSAAAALGVEIWDGPVSTGTLLQQNLQTVGATSNNHLLGSVRVPTLQGGTPLTAGSHTFNVGLINGGSAATNVGSTTSSTVVPRIRACWA